jgi:hypothetical protein
MIIIQGLCLLLMSENALAEDRIDDAAQHAGQAMKILQLPKNKHPRCIRALYLALTDVFLAKSEMV